MAWVKLRKLYNAYLVDQPARANAARASIQPYQVHLFLWYLLTLHTWLFRWDCWTCAFGLGHLVRPNGDLRLWKQRL